MDIKDIGLWGLATLMICGTMWLFMNAMAEQGELNEQNANEYYESIRLTTNK